MTQSSIARWLVRGRNRHARVEAVLAFALGALCLLPASAAIDFDPSGVLLGAGPGGIRSIAAADLDGDGRVDLVTGRFDGTIVAFRNDGTPFLGSWAATLVGTAVGQISVALGDLDNDTDADLVIGSEGGELRVYVNDGTPFDGAWSYQTVGFTTGIPLVRVADLDGDSFADVASAGTASMATGEISIWRNDGTPFDDPWESLILFSTWEPGAIAVADLDGANGPDLIFSRDRSYLSIFQNDGTPFDGGWAFGDIGAGAFGPVTGIAALDLDSDSFLDVVESRGAYAQPLFVWRNDHTPIDGPWPGNPYANLLALAVDASDFDFDGDVDVVTGSPNGPGFELGISENLGSPIAGPWTRVDLGHAPDGVWAVLAVDLDGDLDVDLVSGSGPADTDPLVAWQNLSFISGDPDVSVSASAVDFGTVAPGSSVQRTIDVRNVGGGVLSVSSVTTDLAEFQASPAAFLVGARLTRSINLTFAPSAEGVLTGTLQLVTDDPDEPLVTVTLTGEARYPPEISITPTFLDEVVLSTQPVTRGLDISNLGGVDLTVAADPVPPWVQLPVAGISVPPGQTRRLDVTLGLPGLSPGDYSTDILLRTNDPDVPEVLIPVHLIVIETPDSFDPAGVSLGAGPGGIRSIAAADLDGDGRIDLVTGRFDGTIVAFRNDGTPFLGSWAATLVGTAVGQISVALGDLDNDTDADLVIGSEGGELRVYVNDGTPFDSPWSYQTVGFTTGIPLVRVADLDGDSFADVASAGTASMATGEIGIWRNDGTPFDDPWESLILFSTWEPGAIAVADLDGANGPDLIFSRDRSYLSIFQNDGTPFDGGWAFGDIGAGSFGPVTGIAAVDFDSDSYPDVVESRGDYAQPLFVWRNDHTPIDGPWPGNPYANLLALAVDASDFDFDGDIDVVTGSPNGPGFELGISENLGSPIAGPWTRVDLGHAPDGVWAVLAVDLDGDHDVDLVSGSGPADTDPLVAWLNLNAVTGEPDVSVSPAAVDFGTVALGSSVQQSIVVRNVGGGVLSVSSVTTDLPDFQASPAAFLVGGRLYRSINLTFAPQAEGIRTGTLQFVTDDPDEPLVTVTLTGDGRYPPEISITPTALDETLNMGQQVTRALDISNLGGLDLTVVADPVPEWLLELSPSAAFVPPGQTQRLDVTLGRPGLLPGDYSTTLVLRSNDPDEPEVWIPVHVVVVGTPDIQVGTSEVAVESSRDYSLSGAATNHVLTASETPSGGGSLELVADGDYGDSSESASVIAEGIHLGSVGAVFTDCLTASGTFEVDAETLAVLTADGSVSVTVQNTTNVDAFCAVNRHRIRLTYLTDFDPLDFGQVFVGATAAKAVVVRNLGTEVLYLTSVETDLPEFSISPAPALLFPGASVTLSATFRSDFIGLFEGELSFVSDDPDEPEVIIALRAQAVAAPVIAVTPDHLEADMVTGERLTRTLTVTNSGGSNLTFSTSIALEPALPGGIDPNYPGAEPAGEFAANPGRGPGQAVAGQDLRFVLPVATPGARALLVEDSYPWDASSNETVLLDAGIPFDVANSSQLAALDLARYRHLIVAGDQSSSFYAIVSGEASRIAAWVEAGGVLQFHGAGWGWAAGDAAQVTLPGGASMSGLASDETHVIDTRHPLAAALSPVFQGHGASLAAVQALPAGARIVARDGSGAPTLAEYAYGAGRVFVSGQPLEYGYAYSGFQELRTLLVNLVAQAHAAVTTWLAVEPSSGVIEPGASLELLVTFDAAGLFGGDYDTVVHVGNNDPLHPDVAIPVHMHVTGAPDVEVVGEVISVESSRKYYVTGGYTLHALELPLVPQADGAIVLEADGDFGTSGENAQLIVEGIALGFVGPAGSDCLPVSGAFAIAQDELAAFGADGVVNAAVQNATSVDPICGTNHHVVRLQYTNPVTPLDFGPHYVGRRALRWITIDNAGTDTLHLSGVQTSHPDFSASVAATILPAGSRTTVRMSFTASSTGPREGTLVIQTNDPDEPQVSVALVGEGTVPPDIEVTPTSVVEYLDVGATSQRTVTLRNLGGTDLVYQASLREPALNHETPPPGHSGSTAGPAPRGESTVREPNVGTPGPAGVLAGSYVGTHLAFGLSDFGEVMPFQSPVGTEHLALGNWSSGYTVAYVVNGSDHVCFARYSGRSCFLPVRFDEISNTPQSVVVEVETRTTDGALGVIRRFRFDRSDRFLTVETRLVGLGGGALGSVVFKSHTDWDVDGTWTEDTWNYDRDRNMAYAFEFTHVAMAGIERPDLMDIDGWDDIEVRQTTVQIPQGPILIDGNEVLHYELGGLAGGQEKRVGTVFAAGRSLNELQAAVDQGRSGRWIACAPAEGRLAPGAVTTVTLALNATELLGGDYVSELVLASNDPDEPVVVVPVQLSVTGTPEIDLSHSALDFGTVFLGRPRMLSFEVSNLGSDQLQVSEIASDWDEFTVDLVSFFLAPQETRTVHVYFAPVTAGVVEADLVVKSEDPDEPELHIALVGSGVPEPDVSVRPSAFAESLLTGEALTRPFTVENFGGSELVAFLLTYSEGGEGLRNPGAAGFGGLPDVVAGERPGGSGPRRFVERPSRQPVNVAAPLRVLIVRGSDDDVSTLAADLGTIPGLAFPEEWNGSARTPTLFDLAAYDAVLVASTDAIWDGETLGDVLADYVDAGGGLVLSAGPLTSDFGIGGRLASGGYFPLQPGALIDLFVLLGSRDATHPILSGVSTLETHRLGALGLAVGADLVASWTDGYPLVATKGKRVVAVNLFAHGASSAVGDVVRLLGNAVSYSAVGGWLATSASRVVVPPLTKVVVDVSFDGTGLLGGDHAGSITVISNDPDEEVVTVPATLHFTGIPDAELVTDEEVALESVRDYATDGAATVHVLALSGNLSGGAAVELLVDGDYGFSSETATLSAEGTFVGSVGNVGSDCQPVQGIFEIDAAEAARLSADGVVELTVQNSNDVNFFCALNRHTVRLRYQVIADPLEFGAIFAGATRTRTATLRNAGTDALHVASVVTGTAAFSVSLASDVVAPGASTSILVAFHPPAPGLYEDVVTLYSDDPDEPSITFAVRGEGVAAPDVGLSPAAFDETLFTGQTVTRTLTIANTGGSALSFSLAAVEVSGLAVGRPVLLVQDVPPWDTIANETVLALHGISFDRASSSSLGTTNLAAYDHILVAADQPTGFYASMAAQASRLAAWVAAGGILEAHAAGWGWSGGDASLWILPGGVSIVPLSDYNNVVIDPAHPVVAGVQPTFSGTSASHGYFIGLPSSAAAIAGDSALRPTLVEYPHGEGWVLATGQTLEFSYANGFPDLSRILTNLIAYANQHRPRWLAVSPTEGVVAPGQSLEVALTFDPTGLNGGDYEIALLVETNDPDEATTTVPVRLHVVGAPDVELSGEPVEVVSMQTYGSDGAATYHELMVPVPSSGPGVLTLVADGDYGDSTETATMNAEGLSIGSVGTTGTDCLTAQGSFSIGAAEWAALTADGVISVEVQNSPNVNVFCSLNQHAVQLSYMVLISPLEFGSVVSGSTGVRSVTVRNAGTEVLEIVSVQTDSSEFFATAAASSVDPGESTTVAVVFQPHAPGIHEGQLTIRTNDPDEPDAVVDLRGEGLLPLRPSPASLAGEGD